MHSQSPVSDRIKSFIFKYLRPFLVSIISLFIFFPGNATKYYVAPGGNDTGAGTISAPFFSLNKAWSVVAPGDTIYVRGGTYNYSVRQSLTGKQGTANNLIKIYAYPNEFPKITRASGSSVSEGIYIKSNYLHIRGLELYGYAQLGQSNYYCILGYDINDCIFENIVMHDAMYGLGFGHDATNNPSGTTNGNLVLNCDAYNMSDPLSLPTAYEHSNGFDMHVPGTGVNTFRGCRAWWCADDGYDFFNNDNHVILDNCWAFWNGYLPGTFTGVGNGNGFKLGTTQSNIPGELRRTVTNCLAFENLKRGFDQNNARCIVNLYNNTSFDNGTRGFDFYYGTTANIVRNNISYNDGNIPIFTAQSIVDHNSFLLNGSANPAINLTSLDFSSLSSSGANGPRQSNGSLPSLPFLHLVSNSDLIDAGINVGLPYNSAAPDLGAFEYTLSSGNQSPLINNQVFNTNENNPNGTIIGTVVATDPDPGQTLTYSIISGNTNGAFAINSSSGVLSVANTSALNYESNPIFSMIVKVQDNGAGFLSNQATVTINLINVNEVPVITNQAFSVAENSANGSAVGTVVASDPDAGQTLSFSILSGNTGGAFVINASSGAISVAASTALNFETTPSFALVVKVQDNGTTSLSSQATVTIALTNVNEAPVIANQSFSVAENSANGTAVGTVAATDPDAGQTLSYSILSGNTGGAFAINTSSGAVTVATSSALNFETTPSFALVVKVQDNGTTSLSSQATVTITLTNVNEAPVIANQSFSVAENSANGTSVGTVAASDPDAGQTLSYSILSGNTGGAFAINTSTGAITVATSSALNFETTPSFALVVKVQDNGTTPLSSQATVTINLINVNEPPVVNNQTFSVIHNASVGTLVGTIAASDPDQGQTLTYSIISGNTSNAFTLNQSTGALTVANSSAINYQTNPVFSLNIRVTDNGTGNLFDDATITINVNQVTNQPPVILAQSFNLNENSSNGTLVGTVVATDPNAGQVLTFSIISGNTSGAFTLSPTTGVLSVANTSVLNFETTPAFYLQVRVQDNGVGNLTSQATITVTLINLNEPPVISNQNFTINENTSNGTSIGTVIASDPDIGQVLTYSILSGNTNGAFSINPNTGMLSVANTVSLNFESNPLFNLVVKVQDNGSAPLSSQAAINVYLNNLNESPVIANQTFSINENAANGTSVGNVLANDPDAGQSLTYSILSGNTGSAFIINPATGNLTVNNSSALNYETTPLFSLQVKAQDNGSPALSSQAIITVNLLNLNEPPTVTDDAYSILENMGNGQVVGTVNAFDPDAGQSLNYTIVSGNTNGAFGVNSTTGVIAVANSTALNYEAIPLFFLTIRVKDNGVGNLSSLASIIIDLNDINEPPVINNQAFSVYSYTSAGIIVGTVVATDPDAGQNLSYSITGGNSNGAFAIHPTTGAVSVANSSYINNVTNPSYTLTVRATDDGSGSLFSSCFVTITVLPNSNQPPVILNQNFSINENSDIGSLVGMVSATDPNSGQLLTFSIVSGNTYNAFNLNSSTGALTVNNASALNFETNPIYNLIVKVQDNGTGYLSCVATITVALINLNEAPIINAQQFAISERTPNGSLVGSVVASDPDAGQTLTFSILSGNTGGAFAITTSGLIFVANTSVLVYGTNPVFYLAVKVQDNGSPSLNSQAIITIYLEEVFDSYIPSNGITEEPSESFSKESGSINVFPNPTTGLVNIDLNESLESTNDYILVDLNGSVVYEKRHMNGRSIKLDLSHLHSGSYLLNIISPSKVHTKWLVID